MVRKDVIRVSTEVAATGGRAGRRVVLLGVAGLLVAAAVLAIGILLFGDFGSTEGRILATTALLGGYGLLTLPAAMLRDRREAPGLVVALIALTAVSVPLALALVWSGDAPDTLGKAFGTSVVWLVAAVLPASLTLRRRATDPRAVDRLFAASWALALLLAVLFTVLLWGDGSDRLGRAFAALVVLEALLVALQPVVARARPAARVYHLRVRVAPGAPIDLDVEAADLAGAAARAIRSAERSGRHVTGLDDLGSQPPLPTP